MTVNPDGSGLRKVGPGYDPEWSPDGNKILYENALGDNTYEVWLMNSDGTGARKLADGFAAVWSPDGTQIAYISNNPNGTGEIWVMNADGSSPQKENVNPPADVTPAPGNKPWVLATALAWSSSSALAYAGLCGYSDPNWGYFTIDANLICNPLAADTEIASQTIQGLGGVSWSPDETRLAITIRGKPIPGCGGSCLPGDVFIAQAGATSGQQITHFGSQPIIGALTVAYSPDGAQLLVNATGTDNEESEYIVNPDGSNQHRLTDANVQNPGINDYDVGGSWQPCVHGVTVAAAGTTTPCLSASGNSNPTVTSPQATTTTSTVSRPTVTTPPAPGPGLATRVCGSGLTTIATGLGGGGAGLTGFIHELPGWGLAGAAMGAVGLACTAVVPARPNSPQWAEAACGGLGALSIQTGVASLFGAAFGVVPGLLLGGVSLLTGGASLIACAGDPPRQTYRTITIPRLHVIHLTFGKTVSQTQASLLNAVARNVDAVNDVGQAMMLCIDRASGAAKAKALLWEKRQRTCAATYARRLAGLISMQLPLRKALIGAMVEAGVSDQSSNSAKIIAAVEHFSAASKRQLKTAGLANDQLVLIEQEIPRLNLADKLLPDVYAAIDGPTTVRLTDKVVKGFQVLALNYSR